MFQTFKAAQVPIPPIFGDEPQVWRVVEHNIHRPWFYVTVVDREEDLDMRRMLMVEDDQTLTVLLQSQGADCFIESVQLCTPGHVNESNMWKMEPLERLETFKEDGRPFTVAYTVKGGTVYVTGSEDLVRQHHPNRRLLFCISMIGDTGSHAD